MYQVSGARAYVVLAAAVAINLILGVLYAWSVVGRELGKAGWTKWESALPFAVATAAFAVTMVFAGRVQDKVGPRLNVLLGGVLLGAGMAAASFFTTSPALLCLAFGLLGGTGIGLGYAATTPATIKWFHPSRKGLIAGLVVAGVGLASTYMAPLTMHLMGYFQEPVVQTQPVTGAAVAGEARVIRASPQVASTLLSLGIGTMVVVPLLGLLLVNPPAGYVPREPRQAPSAKPRPAAVARPNRDWNEVLVTPQFYLLWVVFILAACPGLMMLANAAGIADAQAPGWKAHGAYEPLMAIVKNLGVLLVVTLAFANTAGRVVSGYVSDRLGRTHTMVLFFLLQAVNMFCFTYYRRAEWLLFGIACTGLFYGGIFTLMPAAMADFFGVKNLGVNYGLLFTAFGVAGSVGSLLGGGVADLCKGQYFWAYMVVGGMLLVAALLAGLTRPPRVEAAEEAAAMAGAAR